MNPNFDKNISDPADESVNAHFPEPFHFRKEKINSPHSTTKQEDICSKFVPLNEKKVTNDFQEQISENDYEYCEENEKKILRILCEVE